MKIFVSWSGELSKQIAEILKKWIPCIIQSAEVFYSSEDIEKGNNWDKTLTTELSECNYGIICLTADNTTAPWINFEAGAIAKALDSKVQILMINIKPSDIKGPLSRYQATKFERDDFYKLIASINKNLEVPLDSEVLKNAFNAMWEPLEKEAGDIIDTYNSSENEKIKNVSNEKHESEALEEILQLLRTQNSLLGNPEALIPIEYLEYASRKLIDINGESYVKRDILIEELLHYLNNVIRIFELYPEYFEVLEKLHFHDIFEILLHNISRRNRKKYYDIIKELNMRFISVINYEMQRIENKVDD